MSRNVFNVSLFHLSLQAIEDLSRIDTYAASVAWTPYRGGFLVQTESRAGKTIDALPFDIGPVFDLAPIDSTHMFFHESNPVLPLPTFDRTQVLEAFAKPPFSMLCNDSEIAERGYEKLSEEPKFDGSPLHFERRAKRLTREFRKLMGDLTETWLLELALGDAHALACGSEVMKFELGLGDHWAGADAALAKLSGCLDDIIDAFSTIYSTRLRYYENILLATRSRVGRSLRGEASWQPLAAWQAAQWRRSMGL